jgi:pilus assembly protein CpaD
MRATPGLRARLGVMALLAALAAGCSASPEEARGTNAPKAAQTRLLDRSLTLRFPRGTTRLSPSEVDRLAGFLREVELRPGELVVLGNGDDRDPLGGARRTQVAEQIRNAGAVPVQGATPPRGAEAAANDPDTVVVSVPRREVVPPACPDWSDAPARVTNLPSSNFGCATASNLGLMVADPRDLVSGRVPGAADAAVAARSVQAYRQGKPSRPEGPSPATLRPAATSGASPSGGNAP